MEAEQTMQAESEQTAEREKGAIKRFFSTKNIVRIAVLTALSFVLYMFVKFPLPFMFASWLEMQISDLPALMGGFMMGPIAGSVIIILKCLLKMPFTSTAFVGELADIAVGLAFVLPSAFIYKFNRTKKGALVGMAVGSLSATAVAVLMNWLVLVPFYVKMFFGGNEQIIVDMIRPLFPSVTWDTFLAYYLPLSVVPFNILRCFIVSLLTFLLYKHTEKLFDLMTPKKKRSAEAEKVE